MGEKRKRFTTYSGVRSEGRQILCFMTNSGGCRSRLDEEKAEKAEIIIKKKKKSTTIIVLASPPHPIRPNVKNRGEGRV